MSLPARGVTAKEQLLANMTHVDPFVDPLWESRAVNPSGVRDAYARSIQMQQEKKLTLIQQLMLVGAALVVVYKLYKHRAQIMQFLEEMATKLKEKLQ